MVIKYEYIPHVAQSMVWAYDKGHVDDCVQSNLLVIILMALNNWRFLDEDDQYAFVNATRMFGEFAALKPIYKYISP